MKSVKTSRKFKLMRGYWEATEAFSGMYICDSVMKEFWELGCAKVIYIVLSNRPSKYSYQATIKDLFIHLDGLLTMSMGQHDRIVRSFIMVHKECYVYVEVEV